MTAMQKTKTLKRPDVRQTIARNLKTAREAVEHTQQSVAELFNPPLTRSAIAQWETGDTMPDIDKIAILSKAYGVSIDSLIFGDSKGATDIPQDALRVAKNWLKLGRKKRSLIAALIAADL